MSDDKTAATPPVLEAVATFGSDNLTLEQLWSTLAMCEAGRGHQPGIVQLSTATVRDMLTALSAPTPPDLAQLAEAAKALENQWRVQAHKAAAKRDLNVPRSAPWREYEASAALLQRVATDLKLTMTSALAGYQRETGK